MWFRRIAILFGLLCGAACTQAPEFAQQYRQRLGGAIDEIRSVLSDFDAAASQEGLDRQGGVARLQASSDRFVRERGTEIQRLQARETRLARQLQDMNSAGPLAELLVVARDFDPAVASRALNNFSPAVPVTPESAVTGLIGFLLGLLIMHGAAWPMRRRRRRARLRAA